ncbi:MAG: ATP-binding protein [Terriglobales bacterium]
MQFRRTLGVAWAVIGLSLAATAILIWVHPNRSITLLVYLPGIVISEALFGAWAGLASVLLSVAGSSVYRIWLFPAETRLFAPTPAETGAAELILLLVGLFLLWLMEQRRHSGRQAVSGARQMAAVMDNISDAVVMFGPDFRVTSMNTATHAMLDRPGETLVGEHAEDLAQRFQFTSSTAAPVPAPTTLEAASRAGIAIHQQGAILDVGRNRRIQVLIHAIPWLGAGGRLEGAVVVITDLTAIKDLQSRLLDNARLAGAGKIFAGLSHDFNHVLDIIRRALAVLELHENAPAAERRRYREMIDRAAVDGAQIVRRMRDSITGGGERTAVDLSQVAREAIELTRPLWRSRTGLEIVSELQPVPTVAGHYHDLQRVLVNLLFNAIEAVGAASGRITVHTEADQHHVRAWVEDTGPGVAAELRLRLFEAYATTKPQGMGLGLFSAAEIARIHGGTLSLASPPGRPARFLLELPNHSPS